jgi:protein-S-isoprenylcysteine O-methyltransferase Ste14
LKLNLGTLVLIVIAALVFAWSGRGLPWTTPRSIGLSIAIQSLLLLCIARVRLGREFSLQAKASTPVTTGLYSRIPKPHLPVWRDYDCGHHHLDEPALAVSSFRGSHSPTVYPARKEAQVMEATFGEAYREYQRKTWV